MNTGNIKPKMKVFSDKEEMEAISYFEKYFNDERKEPQLLLKASMKYRESVNPEKEMIAKLMKALYFYEKGLVEIDDEKAIIYFNKSIEYYSNIDEKMVQKAEFNRLKRLLNVRPNKDQPELYLSLAELSKKEGNEKEFNSFMTLYGMSVLQYLLNTMPSNDLEIFLNALVDFAEKSENDDIVFKVKSIKYDIEASREGRSLKRIELMEKSLEMINLSRDKYGKELIETGIEYEKAMLLPSKLKRNKALALVSKKYEKLGVNKQVEFIQNLISDLPDKITKQINELEQAIIKNGSLVKLAAQVGDDSIHSSFFYSNSYFISGIKKIQCIIKRIAINKKKLTALHIERQVINSGIDKKEDAKMRILWKKEQTISEQMKIDLESLYIFGNVLLDHWTKMLFSVAGKNPSECTFNKLYKELSISEYNGSLLFLWERHREDITWIYYHLRQYRNFFIEHLDRPIQIGHSMSTFGDDYNFFTPASPNSISEKEKNDELMSVNHLAPEWLKNAPDEYWEKKNKHRVLEVTFNNIDKISEPEDCERVWKVWKKLGGSTTSYIEISRRLSNLLHASSDTILSYLEAKKGN